MAGLAKAKIGQAIHRNRFHFSYFVKESSLRPYSIIVISIDLGNNRPRQARIAQFDWTGPREAHLLAVLRAQLRSVVLHRGQI